MTDGSTPYEYGDTAPAGTPTHPASVDPEAVAAGAETGAPVGDASASRDVNGADAATSSQKATADPGDEAAEDSRSQQLDRPRNHPRAAQGELRRRPPGKRRVPPEVAAASKARKVAGRKQRKERVLRALAIMMAIVLVVLVVLSGAAWWLLGRAERNVASGKPVRLRIRQGDTSSAIANALSSTGVVPNANMFRIESKLEDADGQLKPGTYDLQTGMDYATVIGILRLGPPIAYVTVTIPEGFTTTQIAQRLEKEAGIPAEQFLMAARTDRNHYDLPFLASDQGKSLEGYLFPKTYRIKVGSTAQDVVGLMVEQFGAETQGLDLTYAQSRGLTLHSVVTIASMIEREAKVPSDRPLVSSVIYNRLSRGMHLEIDATVQYVLGNKPRLLYRDLRVQSPYNTYLHKGLPPGPIANPGLASLKAAANPRKSGYYFYVLTGRDGSHSFATTEAGFNRLKAQARQGLR